MPQFETIEGGKPPKGNFICPYCAEDFQTRPQLAQHWLESPECARNRFVNNQTQTKYNIREDD